MKTKSKSKKSIQFTLWKKENDISHFILTLFKGQENGLWIDTQPQK